MRYSSLLPLCATLVAACADAGFAPATLPPGASGKTDTPVFKDNGELIDPRRDSDGDGIPDGEEIKGWIVTIDGNGFAVGAVGAGSDEALEVRNVTSDPRYADTDGDGLLDGEERAIKSDPRRIDSDGDTLSDYDEVKRWSTSASSADTDGDARGGDRDNPRPPNFALFDAAELRLTVDAADPTGPLVAGAGATSPVLADTDGDGVNDYDEVLGGVRRPTFAEVPKVKLLPTDGATFDMYFNVVTSEGKTVTTTEGKTFSFEQDGAITVGTSTTIKASHSDYIAAYIKSVDTVGCCLNIVKSESEVGLLAETETRVEQSVALSLSATASVSANQALTSATAKETSSGVSYSSGTIRLALDVLNAGPVPFRMQGLVISVTRYDRITRQVVPVTEIAGDEMSLAPGERRTLNLVRDDVPVQAMRDLMADPASLVFEAARVSLRDQYGLDFDFRMADVMANSASVSLDFGDHSERFFIAANVEAARGVSLGMALTQAGIDYQAEPIDDDGEAGADVWAITINGRGTELHEGVAPDLRERLPYPAGLEPGKRKVKRGWFGAIRRFGDSGEDQPYIANLFEVFVRPGDEITLIYSEDLDRDGVSAVDEARHGSSDSTAHSDGELDGDGLSDYWETRVGWMVETSGRAPYRVFSSPALADTDGDGLDDDVEASVPATDFGTGMDPWLPDTDLDGLGDLFEYRDTVYGLDPNQAVDIETLPKPTVSCQIVAAPRPNGIEPWRYVVEASATDPQADLRELAVIYPGAYALYQSEPTDRIEMSQPLQACYPDPASVYVVATDALGLQSEAACTWGESAPNATELCNGVDDDCDGVIDDGCPVPGGAITVDYATNPATAWVANGEGGTPAALDCGAKPISSLILFAGELVDKIGAFCMPITLTTAPYIPAGAAEYVYDVVVNYGERAELPLKYGGGGSDDRRGELNCTDVNGSSVVTGLFGGADDEVNRLGATCSTMRFEHVNGAWALTTQQAGATATGGGNGGNPFERLCEANSVATYVDLRVGNLVDDISLNCRHLLPTLRPNIP